MLPHGESLIVNGVDVIPFVEAELNRRFPGGHGRRLGERRVVVAQTVRHPVLATDAWLGRAILEIEQPFHLIGQAGSGAEKDGQDMTLFTTVTPPYAEVLEVRAVRVAMVRDFLATVTSDELAATHKHP